MCGNGYYYTRQQYCLVCDFAIDYATTISKDECSRCPNRCWDASAGKCYVVPDGNSVNNNGVCDYTCAPGEVLHIWQGQRDCVKCGQAYQTTEGLCHTMCGNGYYYTGQFCLVCSSVASYGTSISKDECSRCSNRYFDIADQKCYLCPKGKHATSDGYGCE